MKRTVVGILSAFCVTAAGLSILPAAAEASAAAEDASTELESAAAANVAAEDVTIHLREDREIQAGTSASMLVEFENLGETDLVLSQYDCTIQEITNTGTQFSWGMLPTITVEPGGWGPSVVDYQVPANCTAPQIQYQIQLTPKSGEGDILSATGSLIVFTVQDGVLYYFDESRDDKYRLTYNLGEGVENDGLISGGTGDASFAQDPETGDGEYYLRPGYPSVLILSAAEGYQLSSVALDPPEAGTIQPVPNQPTFFEIDLHAPAAVRAEAISIEEAWETDQGVQMEPATPEDEEALKSLRLVTEPASETDTQKVQEVLNGSYQVQAYEIRTENAVGQEERLPSNTYVKVTLPIPAGWDASQTVVYRLEESGYLTDMKGTPNEDGTAISFVTEYFSLYALVQAKAQNPTEPETTAPETTAPETTVPETTAPEGGGQDTDPTLTPSTETPETTGSPESNGEPEGTQAPESTTAPESSTDSQKDSSVRTGDDSQLLRWIVLLVVAVSGLAAAVWMVRRRNSR